MGEDEEKSHINIVVIVHVDCESPPQTGILSTTAETSSTRPLISSVLHKLCFIYKKMSKVRQALGTCQVLRLSSCQVVKYDPWVMLNKFCFHVYAQKSLFIVENVNDFF